MVPDAPAELALTSLTGGARPLPQWLTTFHLVLAMLDPYTAESAVLLPTVGRILRVYAGADCRVGLLVTCSETEAPQFLGPYAEEFLTFADPERTVAAGLGVDTLPALVHIRQDLSIAAAAEGWDPAAWRRLTHELSRVMGWSRPTIPGPHDPAPFPGTPSRA